jgi:hypothetical protein
MLVSDFAIWRQGFGGATVRVYQAGTTNLATVYSDANLTTETSNPQILTNDTRNGVSGGKFVAPIYVNEAYELSINNTDETGAILPPVTSLEDEDASAALVTATDGSAPNTLADIVARTIYALDHGDLGASAATNTATINAAIGIAASAGGGRVILPAGTYSFTTLTLPEGVRLEGQGRGVTILQSTTADKVITINGDKAGFDRLTLDGVSIVSGSIGIFAKAINEIIGIDIEVKRFETGVWMKGGRRLRWRDFFVDACSRGVRWVGDSDAGNGADGDQLSDCQWIGGTVTNCTTSGLELEYEDRPVVGNSVLNVGFEDNTGIAVKVMGAQITRMDGCYWDGNTDNIKIEDDSTSTVNDDNVIDGLVIANGRMTDGTLKVEDTALNVLLDRLILSNVDVTLTTPTHPVIVRDCIEDDEVTIAGTGTKWLRNRSIDTGASFGITTDATVTKAWEIYLEPGERVVATARVIGNQQNGSNSGEYIIGISAKRAGATLAYDAQTANFTVGAIVTGATSGCTARISADSDGGVTGTLTVRSIVKGANGYFQDNEIITDSSSGSATANGTLSVPVVTLLGSNTAIRAAREDVAGWDAAFAANGPALELQVTGAASTTIEWTSDVETTVG